MRDLHDISSEDLLDIVQQIQQILISREQYVELKHAVLEGKELEWFDGEKWVKKHKEDNWTFFGPRDFYRIAK